MTYPVFAQNPDRGPTAEHAGGPVTCAACGCRLRLIADAGIEAWFHFSPIGGRDARGHRVECADLAHNAHGLAAVAPAA